jgi:hypothetical protein
LNVECDFAHAVLERIHLRGEFSDGDGVQCRRQERSLAGFTGLSTRSIKLSVKDSNGALLSVVR